MLDGLETVLQSEEGETREAVTDQAAPGFEAFVEQTWSMLIVTEDAGLYYGGDDGIAAVGANLAMRRMGDPAEVADMCLVLASPLARWMTGTNVEVHGGGEGPAYLDSSTGEVSRP